MSTRRSSTPATCSAATVNPRENLQRTSGREIHPAHRIEVCRRDTIEACRVDDESVWVPLDRFVNSPEDEENGEGGGEE